MYSSRKTPSDESGWAWFIPLHTGVTSVGVVVNKEVHARREISQSEAATRDSSPESGIYETRQRTNASLSQTLGTYPGFSRKASEPTVSNVSPSTRRYLETLELAPGLKKLLGGGKLVNYLGIDDSNSSLIHTASDYSYSSDRYSGDGWRIAGDAGGE